MYNLNPLPGPVAYILYRMLACGNKIKYLTPPPPSAALYDHFKGLKYKLKHKNESLLKEIVRKKFHLCLDSNSLQTNARLVHVAYIQEIKSNKMVWGSSPICYII